MKFILSIVVILVSMNSFAKTGVNYADSYRGFCEDNCKVDTDYINERLEVIYECVDDKIDLYLDNLVKNQHIGNTFRFNIATAINNCIKVNSEKTRISRRIEPDPYDNFLDKIICHFETSFDTKYRMVKANYIYHDRRLKLSFFGTDNAFEEGEIHHKNNDFTIKGRMDVRHKGGVIIGVRQIRTVRYKNSNTDSIYCQPVEDRPYIGEVITIAVKSMKVED